MAINVPIEKFRDYVFKPGEGKGTVFRKLGYAREDAELLASIYAKQANEQYASGRYNLKGKADQFGQRITIVVRIEGIKASTGIQAALKTGWIIRPNGDLDLIAPFSGYAG